MKIRFLLISILLIAVSFPQPSPPQNLTITEVWGYLVLEWEAPEGVVIGQYNIYRDGEYLDSIEYTNYSDNIVYHDVEYCYAITSVNDEGESQESNQECAEWSPPAPVIDSYDTYDESIYIHWEIEETVVVGFEIYSDGMLLSFLDFYVRSYQYDDLDMDEEYCFQITAVYDELESNFSNTICAVPQFCPLQGDINFDGNLNILDIVLDINYILYHSLCPCGDLDGNGVIDILDIVQLVNEITGGN